MLHSKSFLFLPAFLFVLSSDVRADVQVSGKRAVWHALTLGFAGPAASEEGDPNPFLDYRLTVTFRAAGVSYDVPGYFAADGNAANSGATAGDRWRVRFVPDRPGEWTYEVSLRAGKGIALRRGGSAGKPADGDGQRGTLRIASEKNARGFLRYVGKRYLQFAGTGEYYLKSGADSPENFLAFFEFDGDHTVRKTGAARKGEAALAPRHRYAPHVRDWKPGDPAWRGGRGKGIVGAVNYLASKGVNSVYFLTMNIQGDGDDVWPYRSKNDRFRFDCSKLDQWEIVFDHMDRLGVMLHVILTETENEHLFEHEEGGTFADRRKLYYRELIARFAHHRALVWNIGEENGWDDRKRETTGPGGKNNTHEQRKAFADYIRALDPYDHPIVVHTVPGAYDDIYKPLLGHPSFEGPSLQIQLGKRIHEETIRWLDRSARAGRQWVAMLDEIGPADTGVKPDSEEPDHGDVCRYALWGNLMAGGSGCEWYFGYKYPHNDLGLEDFRSRDRMWDLTRYAVEFFHEHLPFTEMQHADRYVSGTGAYCFAKPGELYCVYVPDGKQVSLWLPAARYQVRWYDPRNGGKLQKGSVTSVEGGGYRLVGEPPREKGRDWVALVKLEGGPPASVPEPPPGNRRE